MLQELEATLQNAEYNRTRLQMQNQAEIDDAERQMTEQGELPEYQAPGGRPNPVHQPPPIVYNEQTDLPAAFQTRNDLANMMDAMEEEEREAKKIGVMRIEDYEKVHRSPIPKFRAFCWPKTHAKAFSLPVAPALQVKREMGAAQLEREAKLQAMAQSEQERIFNEMAARIQINYRGRIGRKKAREAKERMELLAKQSRAALKIQGAIRGYLGRRFVRKLLEEETKQLVLGGHATYIQKNFRGMQDRKRVMAMRRDLGSRFIQRVFRGFVGRKAARRERNRLQLLRKRAEAATKIQATWKMMVAREEYRLMRVHTVAATEVQRVYRGHLGRRKAERKRAWENAEAGPERLKLGLKLIEESKIAFERQQEEIDALHRAQEKAENRVSHIHVELKEAEKELSVLERELQEIDQVRQSSSFLLCHPPITLPPINDYLVVLTLSFLLVRD